MWRSYSLLKPGLVLLESFPLVSFLLLFSRDCPECGFCPRLCLILSWTLETEGSCGLVPKLPACGHSFTIKSCVSANMAPFPVCSSLASDLIKIAILRTHYSKYYNRATYFKSESMSIVITFILMQSHNQIQNFGLWCYEVTGWSSHKLV